LPATDTDEYTMPIDSGSPVNGAGELDRRVIAIHNFGAGDISNPPAAGATLLLPFTNAVVPNVDLAAGALVIELPAEIEGEEP